MPHVSCWVQTLQEAQERLEKLIQDAETQRDTEIPSSPPPELSEESVPRPAKCRKLSRQRTRSLKIASVARARKATAPESEPPRDTMTLPAPPPQVPDNTEEPTVRPPVSEPEPPTAEPSIVKDNKQAGPADTADEPSKHAKDLEAPSKTASQALERDYDAEKEDAQNPWSFEDRTTTVRTLESDVPSPTFNSEPRKDLLPEFSAAASGIWPLRDPNNPALLALPAPPCPEKKNDDVPDAPEKKNDDDAIAISDDGPDLKADVIMTALGSVLDEAAEKADPCLYKRDLKCATLPKPSALHDDVKDEVRRSDPYTVIADENEACMDP